MNTTVLNDNLFHDARVEEIINETTVRLAVRTNDDEKIIKVFYIDNIKETKIIKNTDQLKAHFMIDLLSSIIPIGSFIKIKVIEDDKVIIFNRSLDKNINNLLKIVQNSNANYNL